MCRYHMWALKGARAGREKLQLGQTGYLMLDCRFDDFWHLKALISYVCRAKESYSCTTEDSRELHLEWFVGLVQPRVLHIRAASRGGLSSRAASFILAWLV